MDQATMTVLADEVVNGYRVVTYYTVYPDKIMSRMPYRTDVVAPGETLPSRGINRATEAEALGTHRKTIAGLRLETKC